MSAQSFNTPILLIIFNRADCLQQVFQRIRELQPAKLYLAADGPRPSHPEDVRNCEAARRIVINNIDWPCQFITRLNEQNLGCGRGVSSAISWFFEHEPEGIILEDDCLVDSSFFPFAQEMLEKYVGVGWRTIDGDRGLLTIKVDREKLGRHAGRRPSIDIDVKYQDIMDMRAAGMTHAQIIEKIGWSRASYFRAWKNRDGLKPEDPFSYGK